MTSRGGRICFGSSATSSELGALPRQTDPRDRPAKLQPSIIFNYGIRPYVQSTLHRGGLDRRDQPRRHFSKLAVCAKRELTASRQATSIAPAPACAPWDPKVRARCGLQLGLAVSSRHDGRAGGQAAPSIRLFLALRQPGLAQAVVHALAACEKSSIVAECRGSEPRDGEARVEFEPGAR